jgi:hypothetical protein
VKGEKATANGLMFPPMYVSLRVCTTCGRDDRYIHLKCEGWHYGAGGIICTGKVETFRYDLAAPDLLAQPENREGSR